MPSKTPYQLWLPVLLSFFLVGGMILGYNLPQNSPTPINRTALQDFHADDWVSMEEVVRYVDSRYVDEVDKEELVEAAIDKLLDELDPHSNYIPKEELEKVNENLKGNFVGIGVEFNMYKDTILVLNVVKGGPSDKAGLQTGDRILMVEDSLLAGQGLSTEDVVKQLRGKEGTKVKLQVARNGQPAPMTFEVERGKIPINSVDAALMLDEKTGYIKINRFSSTTYMEFMEALDLLHPKGMEDLVIDLRQNPGGYLKEATRILNQIIEERDVMLVYTEGRNASRKEYRTKGAVKYKLDDVAVLIDESSASASEIMAGALQDTDRGLVVGRRSFGKGLVQEQYDLSGGAALRLTIARYYTQSGRLIQKPYDKGEEIYKADTQHHPLNNEIDEMDKMVILDSTKYFTKNGRVVYSGGGIMPDVFVAMDSFQTHPDFIVASDCIVPFVYDYLNQEKAALKHKTAKEFAQQFQLKETDYEQFVNYCVAEKSLTPAAIQVFTPQLKERIRSQLARYLYGNEGMYLVKTKNDKMVQETLSILDESKALLDVRD